MPKDTTNHAWTIPEVGLDEDQWGQILNDFFDDELDRQVVLEGTKANRPSAGSSIVKYYHATDEGIVYYNDDSSWNKLVEDVNNIANDPHGSGSHNAEVLHDGENFDGSSSSVFSNIASIANQDYNEVTQTISSASGTTNLDLSQANTFRVEAVDNLTFTFSNVTSTPGGNSLTVYVVESDGAGPYTLSWPSSVVWNGGSAVGEVSQNSNVEISLLTDDGGTEWRGRKSGEGFA